MNSRDRRTAVAMAAGQAAWDNASPPEDDGREDYVCERVEELLSGVSTTGVDWADFANLADENIASQDDASIVLRMILLLRNGKHELARRLVDIHLEEVLIDCAKSCVIKSMEQEQ